MHPGEKRDSLEKFKYKLLLWLNSSKLFQVWKYNVLSLHSKPWNKIVQQKVANGNSLELKASVFHLIKGEAGKKREVVAKN